MPNYKKTTPREGLTQYTFDSGYTLSVGSSPTHYSDGETTCEIAVLYPQGGFVPMQRCDDVAGYKPIAYVDKLIAIMESKDFSVDDVFDYFELKD